MSRARAHDEDCDVHNLLMRPLKRMAASRHNDERRDHRQEQTVKSMNLNLDPEAHRALKALAVQNGVTMGDLVRRAIRELIQRQTADKKGATK